MKKQKIFISIIVILLTLCMTSIVFAQEQIFVDLQEVVTDTPPQIINGRTMVPVRAITEMLGYDVYWIAEKQQVEICEKDSTIPVIIMNIDSTLAYYTMYEEALGDFVGCEATLDVPATLINGRTFVPLRFIAEAVNYTVEYNADTADVYLFSPEYMKSHEGEGIGKDITNNNEDGIGEVIPLSSEEMTYLLQQTTESWLAMSQDEKTDLVILIGRWWEDYENIIVEDYDEMIVVLDHQMEQYHKNKVDAGVFETACDIYEIDTATYIIK